MLLINDRFKSLNLNGLTLRGKKLSKFDLNQKKNLFLFCNWGIKDGLDKSSEEKDGEKNLKWRMKTKENYFVMIFIYERKVINIIIVLINI